MADPRNGGFYPRPGATSIRPLRDVGFVLTWKQYVLGTAACAVVFTVSGVARAQRADENAVTAAEDAFGTRVGTEGVGLYDMRSARGFDPQQAGNIRVEGLYMDVQGLFGNRLTRATTMRIGLTAQSYPFPAPTGIADITMHQPADHTVTSAQVQYSKPRGMSSLILDVSTPLIGDKLGMVVGANCFHSGGEQATGGGILTIAGLLRWRPNDVTEVIPFVFHNQTFTSEAAPAIFTAGNFLPPEVDRNVFYGQKWAVRRNDERNLGVITRSSPWPNWRIQVGLFHSQQERSKNHAVFLRNTTPGGLATLDILKYPPHYSGSYSGEARVSGVFTDGSFRHTVHIATRGRSTRRLFGGGQTLSYGPVQVGVYQPMAERAYTLGVRDKDLVRQVTPGITYVGQWANVGEFSLGLQKSFYRRKFGKENAGPQTTESQPWLYNGTLAYYVTPALALYGGYTRGIEEFGTAPDNALNGGQPLPAALTEQIDAGVRYRIIPGVNFIAGVFEVSKPYFDRNTANLFTDVGSLRHRGIEVSLSGKVVQNVTVIAGAVFLQARVSGLTVDQGIIGRVPPGTPPRLMRVNVQYDVPALKGFSLDGQVEVVGGHVANRLNTLRVGSAATLSLGTRYSFNIGQTRANIRLQMQNVTNAYDWVVDGASGRLSPSAPRNYLARLSADF